MSPPSTTTPVQTVSGAIVFTDIAGFTEFTAARGDEAALELLALQERLVREQMDDRGRIVSASGPGVAGNLYGYDPRGLRIRKQDSEGTKLLHLDGDHLDACYDARVLFGRSICGAR